MKISQVFDIDPTRTQAIRNRFEKDIVRRFNVIKRLIRESLVDNRALTKDDALEKNRFIFATNPQKIEQFMDWLREQERDNGLRITKRSTGVSSEYSKPWIDIYLESAYTVGIKRARNEINAAKGRKEFDISSEGIRVAFNQPIHAERIGMIYTRTYSDLEGITEEMDKQISRVLADALINGQSPSKTANDIIDRVDKIGINRARMLARTETIRAHHAANMAEYREAKALGISIKAEILTAGASACEECDDAASKTYTLDEAELLIPIHPNCRCVAIAIFE